MLAGMHLSNIDSINFVCKKRVVFIGGFRTLSNIHDGAFSEKFSEKLVVSGENVKSYNKPS